MKPTKGMPAEELKEEIRERKIAAFDQAIMLHGGTTQLLSASGFKHWADPILFARKMNQARLADWERNNPDD